MPRPLVGRRLLLHASVHHLATKAKRREAVIPKSNSIISPHELNHAPSLSVQSTKQEDKILSCSSTLSEQASSREHTVNKLNCTHPIYVHPSEFSTQIKRHSKRELFALLWGGRIYTTLQYANGLSNMFINSIP